MRRKKDHYTKKAQASGYPARSVYKLEEIQRRFSVLSRGMTVLDIGASPGSWSMYAAKIIGPGGRLVAVDLQPEHPIISGPEYTFVHGDIDDEAIRRAVESLGPFDCVLSDAAPATTGNRTVDVARSAAIVDSVLVICDALLKPRGNLVVKIFQGSDQQRILADVRARFSGARQFKPPASRKASFEVFCVGTNKRRNSGARET